jgi:UDP-2-acetamido-2,6-beta-L-arabino-hexul-4-ose reductase
MRGLPITVNDPNHEISLVYVDDIVDEFVSVMQGGVPTNKEGDYCSIRPNYTVTLGMLAEKLHEFKSDLHSTVVPNVADTFAKKLFSTFVSYAEAEDVTYLPRKNVDARGSFTELINTKDMGQVSVSISKKGVVRGNHFHDTKMEKFIVIKGKAKISFRHMITDETMTFDVDGEDQAIVTIPVGYTHKIENLSDELILLIWCNENFDPEKPDTYFDEV